MTTEKPLIINLFGSPGTGKSTGAAYIFSKLKMAGINAELVTEFAKDKVWEETHAPFENQLYMLAKQYFRITRCENKVDVIITDSPILLSLIYNNDTERLGEDFSSLVKHLFKHYNNYNVMLKRVKPYNPAGRFQTEEESNKLSAQIENMLLDLGIPYISFNGNIDGYNEIANDIISKLLREKENNA